MVGIVAEVAVIDRDFPTLCPPPLTGKSAAETRTARGRAERDVMVLRMLIAFLAARISFRAGRRRQSAEARKYGVVLVPGWYNQMPI